ncbi:hypothetical protein ES703_38515 [subsurface metagenome]
MDIEKLSEADKYLLLGLILKKNRSEDVDRKALKIIRSSQSLDRKIEGLLLLNRQINGGENETDSQTLTDYKGLEGKDLEARKRSTILIIDPHPEITRILKNSSLRHSFTFIWGQDSIKGLLLLKEYQVKIVIVNQNASLKDYYRFYEIIRGIKPKVSIIFLCKRVQRNVESYSFKENIRLLYKPININIIEDNICELAQSSVQA